MKKDKIYPVDPPGYPDLDFKINKDAELKEAREERDKAIWSAEERLQAFYGIQEHSNDMWFLLKDILEKEPVCEEMKAKIKETIYPKISILTDKQNKED